MTCDVNASLVGWRIVAETKSGVLEGDVRSAGSGKITLFNGVMTDSEIKLPQGYKVFVKDIISIKKVSENATSPVKTKVDTIQVFSLPVSSSNERKKPLLAHKQTPSHIKNLNNKVDTEILTNRVPQIQIEGKNGVKIAVSDYTVIEHIDGLYSKVISTLAKESVLGLSIEGVRIGRNGVVCWIGLANRSYTFLFDMCSLGPPGIDNGLRQILTDPKIVKVTHDCRFMSDAFVHKYKLKLENVFDTQVAAAVFDMRKFGGGRTFNRHVQSLNRTLKDYLAMNEEAMFHPRIRVGHEKEDEGKWTQRPLPEHLLEGAAFNVCHLINLRRALMEALMEDVIRGTNLYLKDVSEVPDDAVSEKAVVPHQIPLSFQQLVPQKKNGEVFHNSIPYNGVDPYVTFTRNVPHVRKGAL